jgi:hypothetical protein
VKMQEEILGEFLLTERLNYMLAMEKKLTVFVGICVEACSTY